MNTATRAVQNRVKGCQFKSQQQAPLTCCFGLSDSLTPIKGQRVGEEAWTSQVSWGYTIMYGRFSETGVHEWMPLVIFRAREFAASLPGRFLSRHCFTLCITMEVEPRIEEQYKCHHCCSCKNYRGKGVEGGEKKCLCNVFRLTRRSRVRGEKIGGGGGGGGGARATSYCLLPDTYWLRASKNVFKVGSVKFANSLSPPSMVKKVRTGSKSSQGT